MIAALLALVFGLLASFFFGMFLMLIIGLVLLIWIGLSFYLFFKKLLYTSSKKGFRNKNFKDEGLSIVKLIAIGYQKNKTIQILCEYCAWDIQTAQQKIESELPTILAYDMSVYKAEELQQELQEAGAIIEIYKI
jgi:hypothetical protein